MRAFLILLLLLAACDTPSRHFHGVDPMRIEVDGSQFDVRVRGQLAEAIRVNPEYAPRFGPIRGRAAFAMARASGCVVREVSGDQALALGKLECEGATPRIWRTGPLSYSCIETPQADGLDYLEFDCEPVRY